MYLVTTKSLEDHVSKTQQLAMMLRLSSELHMHGHTFAHRDIRTHEIHRHTTCTHSYYYHLLGFTNNIAQEATQEFSSAGRNANIAQEKAVRGSRRHLQGAARDVPVLILLFTSLSRYLQQWIRLTWL